MLAPMTLARLFYNHRSHSTERKMDAPRTVTDKPAFLASNAKKRPVGPPPTTTTSTTCSSGGEASAASPMVAMAHNAAFYSGGTRDALSIGGGQIWSAESLVSPSLLLYGVRRS